MPQSRPTATAPSRASATLRVEQHAARPRGCCSSTRAAARWRDRAARDRRRCRRRSRRCRRRRGGIGVDDDHRPARAVDQRLAVVGVDPGPGCGDHDPAVEEPGVDQREPECRGETPAEGRLAAPRGTVDGDDRGRSPRPPGCACAPAPACPQRRAATTARPGAALAPRLREAPRARSGPTAIRTRSRTSRPIAANSRRTSRLRPSAMTTSTTESDPERFARDALEPDRPRARRRWSAARAVRRRSSRSRVAR